MKEYLPIVGLADFNKLSAKLMFGADRYEYQILLLMNYISEYKYGEVFVYICLYFLCLASHYMSFTLPVVAF